MGTFWRLFLSAREREASELSPEWRLRVNNSEPERLVRGPVGIQCLHRHDVEYEGQCPDVHLRTSFLHPQIREIYPICARAVRSDSRKPRLSRNLTSGI